MSNMHRDEENLGLESTKKLPLVGIRVLDFTQLIAGASTTLFMAYFGAEVIHVESHRRPDAFRGRPGRGAASGRAYRFGRVNIEGTHTFGEFGRNKLSITLDMTTADGREIARRLIKICDVLVENYSYRVMKQWGLDYPEVRALRPDIIMVSLQGLGHTGPFKEHVTWGPNLMPLIGMTYVWNHPGASTPIGSQIAHPDYNASILALVAILAALHHRNRTGEGQFIDVAQAEAAQALLGVTYLDYFVNGLVREPIGNSSLFYAPYGCYRCQGEDRWCVIAVRSEEEWQRFCVALGKPDWTCDPRFTTMASRLEHRKVLDRYVEEWTAQRGPHEVMELLQQHGVAAGAVQNAEDLFHDLHLRQRGFLTEMPHPETKTLTYPGVPMHLSTTPGVIRRHAPLLGQDNEYIFGELLGMSAQEAFQMSQEQAREVSV